MAWPGVLRRVDTCAVLQSTGALHPQRRCLLWAQAFASVKCRPLPPPLAHPKEPGSEADPPPPPQPAFSLKTLYYKAITLLPYMTNPI
jgi:hypothetical protein